MRVSSLLGAASAITLLLGSTASAQLSSAGSPKPLATHPPLSQSGPPTSGVVVGGSDDCSTAAAMNAISGPGVFAVSTVGATNGGPDASGCVNTQIDVWFYWTATATASTTIHTCTQVTADSVMTVWADNATPGMCPTGTTAIACNDDSCGLQSSVTFPATAGTSYFIQMGAFSAAATYSGTFTVFTTIPPSGDACSAPIPISGVGTFPFDNTGATTGPQGQTETLCLFFGTTGITNDIWYDWTCPATGTATVATCGGTTMDSKIAVYGGGVCPTAAAIACNDDDCSLQSRLSFACTVGAHYSIQLGDYPGAAPTAGTFTISVEVPPCAAYDDGVSENSVGLTVGGDLVWLHKQGSAGQSAVIVAIRAAYGSALFPGSAPPAGTPTTIAVWDDPNDDGNPNDLVLLRTVASSVQNGDTDTFNVTSLVPPLAVNGVYFIGVSLTHNAGQFPAPLDQSSASIGRAWVAGGATGTIDLANLNAASVLPPTDVDLLGLPGVWLLRPDCDTATGTGFCGGTTTTCPCANAGLAGQGCANFVNANGALLAAAGNATVGSDTLTLLASGMQSGSFCLFAQSTATASGLFGDGRQCLASPMVRIRTREVVSGNASYGAGVSGDAPVSVLGGVVPGTYHYQGYYRDALPFCTLATFNSTNGLTIVWN